MGEPSRNIVKNPFKKAFWAKDNLIPPENMAQIKGELAEVKAKQEEAKANRKADDVSNKLMRLGLRLTGALTLPIIGFVLFNIVGLIIGLLIGLVILFATKK